MYKYIVLIFGLFLVVNAYELPKIDLEVNDKPQIVFFMATDIAQENKHSYLLKWKTTNATKVTLTFIGKVANSGNITITEDEYNRGPVTLKAFDENGSPADSVTINDAKIDLSPPIKFKEKKRPQVQPYYHTPSIYNNPLLPYGERRRSY